VLQHGLAAVRRDDAEFDVVQIGHVVVVRAGHRPGMEGGELVVVEVGGDEALRRELVLEHAHALQADTATQQVLAIGPEILPDGGQRQRIAAQELQVVGDVARTAAELAPHLRHQKGHVEDVDLVRKDVVLELVGEHHDGVVGQGTADDG